MQVVFKGLLRKAAAVALPILASWVAKRFVRRFVDKR
jgi:hypothetical protein